MATGSESKARIQAWRRSSFDVVHNVFKGAALAIEAFETRVLVGRIRTIPQAEIGPCAGGDHWQIHEGLTAYSKEGMSCRLN